MQGATSEGGSILDTKKILLFYLSPIVLYFARAFMFAIHVCCNREKFEAFCSCSFLLLIVEQLLMSTEAARIPSS